MSSPKHVLWLHTQPEHYFNCMMDELSRTSEYDYSAGFIWQGAGRYKERPVPQSAPTIILRPKPSQEGKEPTFLWPFHEDWRSDLASTQPYDAIIVSGYGGATQRQIIRECRRRKIPVALFSDSNLRTQRGRSLRVRWWRLLKRRFLAPIIQSVDYVLTANSLGVAYWRYYGAPKDKIIRCPYYADYERIEAARTKTRAEVLTKSLLDPDRKIIITAARLIDVKGLHLMINAFRESGLAQRGWTYVLAGTGELEARLKKLAGPDLGNSIRFLGFVQPAELLALIHHAHLFVLPSVYEPHGIVIQEALAAETPVLASDVCGAAHDLVHSGRSGWVFRSEDQADLLKKLLAATSDEARLAAMRPQARAIFEAWFKETNPVVVVDRIIHMMLEAKSGAHTP